MKRAIISSLLITTIGLGDAFRISIRRKSSSQNIIESLNHSIKRGLPSSDCAASAQFGISDLRKEYSKQGLLESDISDDPFDLFTLWFQEACKANVLEPNAMVNP